MTVGTSSTVYCLNGYFKRVHVSDHMDILKKIREGFNIV